jgi:hypothetical protein
MFHSAARSLSIALLPILRVLLHATGTSWAQEQTVSSSVVGNIEAIKRQGDGRLVVTGWSLDVRGNGDSVWVLSIYDGQVVFTGSTSGGRADISKAYPQAITDNTAISGTGIRVDCRASQKVISLAITTRHQVAIIGRNDIEGCPP